MALSGCKLLHFNVDEAINGEDLDVLVRELSSWTWEFDWSILEKGNCWCTGSFEDGGGSVSEGSPATFSGCLAGLAIEPSGGKRVKVDVDEAMSIGDSGACLAAL